MNTRTLGKTGRIVSELGLGGTFYPTNACKLEEAEKITLKAIEMGINYIDSGSYYYPGEKVQGEILAKASGPLILSSRLDIHPSELLKKDRKALENHIRKGADALNRKHIDVLCIYDCNWSGHGDRQAEAAEFYGPLLDAADSLKEQGLIGNTCVVGSESARVADMVRTDKFDMVMTVYNYSLLWREAELELLPLAKEKNMGIIIGSPLQSMALATRFTELTLCDSPFANKSRNQQFRCLYEISDEYKIGLLELALRFVLSNPDISCILMHPHSVEEVDRLISIIDQGPLQEDILKHLKEVSEMVPFMPYKELFVY